MMSTADGSVANPSYGGAGGPSAPPPIFRRTFVCFVQMVSFRPVHACFMIVYDIGGVTHHPPPPRSSSSRMSVTAALSALSFVSERTSGGERQNSDSRVDASDVDTDISSRLMYNIVYVFLFVLACLLV